MPCIFLVGFMASGKSEVARLLAGFIKMPCVDLDRFIEEQAGMSITSIFEERGEEGFRERERYALELLADGEASVISTGGGTACQSGLMETMRSAGLVVNLATDLSTALARVGGDRSSRPLLGRPGNEVEALYQARAPLYRRAHISVSTEGKSLQTVASDVMSAIENQLPAPRDGGTVVALRERSYPIHTEVGCLEKLGEALKIRLPKAKRIGLISDDNVMPLYGDALHRALERDGYDVVSAVIPAGEASKTIKVFSRLVDAMIEGALDRNSVIIALGGGVVGDLGGYVAASLYRGVAVVQVPTTLLAMTDSAIGGKTGINSKHGKNLLGAFWQPSLVWSDPRTLDTLSPRERRAAFGELVKYALLDGGLWAPVQALAQSISVDEFSASSELCELVRACSNLKASIVSTDERESGLRATLNLGHTVGHAIESQAGPSAMLHGEAVALGLLATCRVSALLGVCAKDLESKVATILEVAGLATNLDEWLREDVLCRVGVDKKRSGDLLRFIVVAEPGDVSLREISLTTLKSHLLAN